MEALTPLSVFDEEVTVKKSCQDAAKDACEKSLIAKATERCQATCFGFYLPYGGGCKMGGLWEIDVSFGRVESVIEGDRYRVGRCTVSCTGLYN